MSVLNNIMGNFDISILSEQNPWWIDSKNIQNDHKLKILDKSLLKWEPNIEHYIELDYDAIYTLRGPRQVGKTTLIKNIIRKLLLTKKINPENIFFWSFERNTPEELNKILQTYFNWRINNTERKFIFLDEISSVKEWYREIIYFANKGDFENCSVVVTGSHSMDIKYSTEKMPGRRGGTDNPLDKILLPMKFSEYVKLLLPTFKQKMSDCKIISSDNRKSKIFDLFDGKISKDIEDLMLYKKQLDSLLEMYLITGGIPSTINEFKKTSSISKRLYNVYLQAIIGDLNRYNFKEKNVKQILTQLFTSLATPISWNNITKTTEIKHHETVDKYISAFEDLFISNVVYRKSLDKRAHYFYKKVYFQDPFIFHALNGWVFNKTDYFKNTKENIFNIELKSKLLESVLHNHLCRFVYGLNPHDLFVPRDNIFYYRDRSEKEIDFLILSDDKLYPIELKYQKSISESDFKLLNTFKKGILISRDKLEARESYSIIPISIFLMLI